MMAGCKGVKGMNGTKGGCWGGGARRIVGAWEPHSEHGEKEGRERDGDLRETKGGI